MTKNPHPMKILILAIIWLFSLSSQAARFNTAEDLHEQSMKEFVHGKTHSWEENIQWDNWDQQFKTAKAKNKPEDAQFLSVYKKIQEKQYQAAEKQLQQLLAEYPNDIRYLNLYARLNDLQDKTATIKQSYEKVLKQAPDNITALLGLIKNALSHNDFKSATKLSQQLLNINDQLYIPYLVLTSIAEAQNQIDSAETILIEAINKTSSNFRLQFQFINILAAIYEKHGMKEKILPVAKTFQSRFQEEALALAILAKAQILNQKYAGAEKNLKKIIQLNPDNVVSRLILADLLKQSKNRKNERLNLIDKILTIDASNTKALRLKAEILLADQQTEKALALYEKAYQIKPQNQTLFMIVDLMKLIGKTKQLVLFLEEESQKADKFLLAHYELGSIYLQASDQEKAIHHYQLILKKKPDHVLTLNNLAWIYSEQNNPAALDMAKKAHTLANDSPEIADTYGMILIKQGYYRSGLTILKKAAAKAPGIFTIQYHLALAHSVNKETKQAIKILQRLKTIKQTFPEKQDAMKLLQKLSGINAVSNFINFSALSPACDEETSFSG